MDKITILTPVHIATGNDIEMPCYHEVNDVKVNRYRFTDILSQLPLKVMTDPHLLDELSSGQPSKKLLYRYINKLQKILLEKILPQKLETINEKEKLIDFIYQLRYYNLIQYNSEREIKDVKELQENLTNLEKLLIKKLYSLKIINTLSTSERNDIEIVRNIFYLRTISLENLYLELFKIEENKYNLNIYDEKDTLEESKDIQLQFNKKDKIKLKRKVKLF